MFYLYFILSFLVLCAGAFFLKIKKYDFTKLLKILTIVYCVLILFNILLPDAFVIEIEESKLANMHECAFAILRWLSCAAFVIFPIAVFFNKQTFKNIAATFCVVISIICVCFYPKFIEFFTSMQGKGLNTVNIISQSTKTFFINKTFRSIWIGLVWNIELLIPFILILDKQVKFDFKHKKDITNYFVILVLILFQVIPIYAPQYIIGITDIILDVFSFAHIAWLLLVVTEIIVLYFVFRHKSKEDKYVLCFVLSLALLLGYSEMFGAVPIILKKIPLQLCNIAAYFLLISLITKNKKFMDFMLIVNVVGVALALAVPDLYGKGIGFLWNMHFIVEHTNIVVTLTLILLFGDSFIGRIDRKSLKHALIGFCIYFFSVLFLGTIFNAIYTETGNYFFEANYFFMFNENVAAKLLGDWVKTLFKDVAVGKLVFHPLIQIIVFAVFIVLCIICYLLIRLIYKIYDKRKNKKKVEGNNEIF